jgi:F-type H+-transporting ATPase subunit b
MDLSIDLSFLAQLVLFCLLWFGLKRLVFDPVLEVLDERKRRTVAAQAEAERLVSAAELARAEYDRSLHEMRLEMAQETSAARNAAQEESQRALAKARAAAQDEISQLRSQVSAQVDEARRGLVAQAEAIAGQMLDRVARGGHA